MHSIYSLCKRLQQSFSNSKMAADKPSAADDKDRDCSVSLLSQPHRIIEEKQQTIKGKRRKRRRLCCCCLVCMTSCLIALAVILMFVVLFSDHTLSLRWHLSEKFGINLPDYQKPTSLGKRYVLHWYSLNDSQSWLHYFSTEQTFDIVSLTHFEWVALVWILRHQVIRLKTIFHFVISGVAVNSILKLRVTCVCLCVNRRCRQWRYIRTMHGRYLFRLSAN